MEQWAAGGAESLVERGVVPAGIAGAIGGALGAVALGATTGTAYPEACGAAGVMFGSAGAALVWWALATVAGAVFAFRSRRLASHAGAPARPAVPHA